MKEAENKSLKISGQKTSMFSYYPGIHSQNKCSTFHPWLYYYLFIL